MQWWNSKWLHFLFFLPNRKCQRFPADNWLICAISKFLTSPLCSSAIETPFLGKLHKTINYCQENACTSCLASKTGNEAILNFIIALSIPKNQWKKHRSSIKWQENADTSCFWPVLTYGGSALFPFALKMDTLLHRHQFIYGVQELTAWKGV